MTKVNRTLCTCFCSRPAWTNYCRAGEYSAVVVESDADRSAETQTDGQNGGYPHAEKIHQAQGKSAKLLSGDSQNDINWHCPAGTGKTYLAVANAVRLWSRWSVAYFTGSK